MITTDRLVIAPMTLNDAADAPLPSAAVPARGQGFATEAAKGVVGWGIEHLGADQIFASIRPPNPASCRVLEHAGMVKVLDYDHTRSRCWLYMLPERPVPS